MVISYQGGNLEVVMAIARISMSGLLPDALMRRHCPVTMLRIGMLAVNGNAMHLQLRYAAAEHVQWHLLASM
jgi:hypothetical protein